MNHSLRSNDAIRPGIGLDDFELDGAHATSYNERVILVYRAIGLQEVGLQVHLEKITTKRRINSYTHTFTL